MKEQRKTLKELLNENSLGAIATFITEQISQAHPGCDTDHKFSPQLNKISVGYWAPEPCRDLCLMLDSSCSIDQELFKAIGEGAREAFRVGLGDGQRRNYAVINFSYKTIFSGWVPKTQHERLEPVIDTYQQEVTQLNPKVVAQLSEGNRRVAILMVTDGGMQNEAEIIPVLEDLTKHGNRIGIIYVGKDMPCQGRMEKFANVFCIRDKDKLIETMKDYAQATLKQE